MQKPKSLVNLHDFQHELFLGFISQQPLAKPQYQLSYIGGSPLWLYEPNPKLLVCQQCTQEPLTFLGQIFCPLDAEHTYNRIMYLFFCQKCKRQFRCLKQQSDKNWQPKHIQVKSIKLLSNQSYQIQSQGIQRRQLIKIMSRAKIQVQEQIIMEQQGQNQQQVQGQQQVVTVQKLTGQQMMNKLEQLKQAKRNRQYTQKEIEQINRKFEALKLQERQQKEREGGNKRQMNSVGDVSNNNNTNNKKDQVFEQYVRVIKQLNNPIMIYSNIPLPYNKLGINPKHICKYCTNKLSLQIQITQKVLLFRKELAVLDWGSVFIYTCVGSCDGSQEECVVVQYEVDAISEEEINRLKKVKKGRKKNKNKSLSKEKKRMREQMNEEKGLSGVKKEEGGEDDDGQEDGVGEEEGQDQCNEKKGEKGEMKEKQQNNKEEQQGDWD